MPQANYSSVNGDITKQEHLTIVAENLGDAPNKNLGDAPNKV